MGGVVDQHVDTVERLATVANTGTPLAAKPQATPRSVPAAERATADIK